jgi:hypothetical protein
MDHWEFTKRTGTLVGLSGAVVALSWFCFSTISRINTLEAHMQALSVSASVRIAPQSSLVGLPPMSPAPSEQNASASPSVNPINQVCADLAIKLLEKNKDKGGIGALDPIAATMERLNCQGRR